MNFVLEIYEAFVADCGQSLEYSWYGHFAFAYGDLVIFSLEVGEVFHVDVEQPGSGFVDGLNDVSAGTNGMSDIDATADARIKILHRFQYIQRRVPQLILRPVIVD